MRKLHAVMIPAIVGALAVAVLVLAGQAPASPDTATATSSSEPPAARAADGSAAATLTLPASAGDFQAAPGLFISVGDDVDAAPGLQVAALGPTPRTPPKATGGGTLPGSTGTSASGSSATGSTTAATLPDWKLVWNDEFDKPGLVDSTKWDYEEGYIRNGEKQYYTKARKENCRVEGGSLIITGLKEKYPIAAGKGKGGTADYTSASLFTANKTAWQYGRIEMRAKLPQGKGTWPAFWTLGATGGWPQCGEIDIMEFVGKTPDKVYSTLHWNAGGHKQKGSPHDVSQPWADFHVYAVEWFQDRIDSYYDTTKYNSINLSTTEDGGQSSFRKPHYIKLNLALGGDWGAQIDDGIFPTKYIIDYVRVYAATTAK